MNESSPRGTLHETATNPERVQQLPVCPVVRGGRKSGQTNLYTRKIAGYVFAMHDAGCSINHIARVAQISRALVRKLLETKPHGHETE